MRFSPGECIGWFFVPIAALWMPLQAMKEIWRASDPRGEQGAWITLPSTPLIDLWWASWILSEVVGLFVFSVRGDARAEGAIGLAARVFTVMSAVGLIAIMRRIAARQERAAAGQAGSM